MNEKRKRLMCTLLAAVLIISYAPMSVSAIETEPVDVSEPETEAASETETAILIDMENPIQTASEETVIASGWLASGHSWEIMSDGTLHIIGSGAMPCYSKSPWIGYVDRITSIVIDPGTTSIGDYAFYELGMVKTAVIPDTVTSIGTAAFCWCEGLTSIEIPGSVRTIGEDAFWCCLDLVSLTFHEGLQTIEQEAFQGCRLITELKFPESLKSIGYWAFGRCSDLVSVEIPAGVKKLDDSVFSACTSLRTVKLNEGLISIGNSTFAHCYALDAIVIPGSVQSIGETAFYGCSQLGTVTFTGNPPVMAENTFAAAVAILRYPSVNTAWSAYAEQQYGGTLSWRDYSVAGHNYADTVIAPTCTEWGYTTHRCTDEGCDTYYMDSYQDALGHSWDEGISSGSKTTYTCVRCGLERYEYSISGTCGSGARWALDTQTGVLQITGTGTITVRSGYSLPWKNYISGIRHVIIEPGITGIGAGSFYECGSIETIEIPDTVKSIGAQAFVWCSSLKEVTIPEGVTSIGESTFWGCESMETLNLPSTLQSIGEDVFYRCDSLKTLEIPDSVTSIGKSAFWNCGGITQITVPKGVTKLSEDVFASCSNLQTVYLPDTLTEIGTDAFSYCRKLQNITIPDSVTYLGETAFYGCNALKKITIPGGVTKLERGVFSNCSNMQYVTFSGEPPVFAEDAFQGLSAGIRYPSVLRSAWLQHTSQEYAGTVYWSSYSVAGHNYVTKEVAPTCENRGYTRHTCTDSGCTMYYMDSYTDALGHNWNEGYGSVTMWTYTCTVCEKTRTVYTVGGSCGTHAEWSLNTDEGVLTIYGSGGMNHYSRTPPWNSYKDSIKKVIIKSGITSIGNYAFYEHAAIESVEIADTVRSLGVGSFCWCENLKSVRIPEGVTSIPENCFWACLSMEEISLPSTLKTIGEGAFYSNEEVTQLDLPAGITDIGECAFWDCSSIQAVTIPIGVTILRESAFSGCESLKTVVLHDNITEIQRSAFNSCSSLTSMTLPRNLRTVGVNALTDIKVSSLTFHEQVEFLDEGILYGAAVKEIHFLGDVPEFDAKVFRGYTGTVYYPRYNQTWTASARQNYGGSITWKGEGTCPHSYELFVTPPACEEMGFTEYVCTICGDVYVDDYVVALGHDMSDWTVTGDATCTEDGEKRRDCSRCDHFETETIEATGHQYESAVTDPSCTEQGYTTYTCECGDSYVDSYVDALGHAMGEWAVTKEATCTDDGEKRRDCSRCAHFETEVIEASGHNYEAVVTAPTCTEQGYTTNTCSCGDSYVDAYVDALGHKWDDGVVTKEPTEEATGTKLFACERCGETREETLPKLDHVHAYTSVVTDPTCTEKGYTTHTCKCGDSYVDSYVDALDHDMGDWVVVEEATCTEDGEKRKDCSRCAHFETENIEAAGHNYEAVVTEPTCTEKGYTTHTCKCGDSYVDTYVDALDHKWDAGVITKEPTEDTTGTKLFTCERCGETREETLPKLDHVHAYTSVVTEPTYTEKGYTKHTCSCGDSYVDSYVDPLPLPEAEVAVARMILGNELAMQFAFPKDKIVEGVDYVVSVTKTYADGREDKNILVPMDQWGTSGSYYYVSFNGIAAKEMGDTINAQILTADGAAVGGVYTDSVKAYAVRQLRKATEAEIRTLYVDMLNYGAAAQTYFKYDAENLVTDGLTPDEKAYGTKEVKLENNLVKGTGYVASQLDLGSSILLRVKFNGIDSSMHAVVSFTNHMGVQKDVTIPGSEFISGGTVVVIDDVVAADYDRDVTITVYEASGNAVASAVESVASYIARMSGGAEIYSAVAKYCAAAYGYLHKSN